MHGWIMCFPGQELSCASKDLCLLSLLALQFHVFIYLLCFTIMSFIILFHYYIIMIMTLKAGRNITCLPVSPALWYDYYSHWVHVPLGIHSSGVCLFFFFFWVGRFFFFFFFCPSLPSCRHSGTSCSVVKSCPSYGLLSASLLCPSLSPWVCLNSCPKHFLGSILSSFLFYLLCQTSHIISKSAVSILIFLFHQQPL